ncbi:uncharacterized protein LOC62_04G006392 [Vanrija pseudolonga]|uniref:Uncharacterized protein n=1 Tax=Vanrija pseudolonga TaxID=143232 RepID=A0AAF0YAJ6_9TREE|nr:hypothetical protein LOC62_04G006392 [Vanrija pseudolonga]
MLLALHTFASLLLASLVVAQSQSTSTPTAAPTAPTTIPTGGVATTTTFHGTINDGAQVMTLDTATVKYILANVTVKFPTSSDWWAAEAKHPWPNLALLGGPLNNVSLPPLSSLPQGSRYYYAYNFNLTLNNDDTSLLKAPLVVAQEGRSGDPSWPNFLQPASFVAKELINAKVRPGQGYYLRYLFDSYSGTSSQPNNFLNVTSDKFEIRAGSITTYPANFSVADNYQYSPSEAMGSGAGIVLPGSLLVVGLLAAAVL